MLAEPRTVCLSGGEPLLYPDRVMELVSLVPEHLHIKVCTNGDALTPYMVDLLNERGVELHLSHDGPNTARTRGADVLADARQLGLIRRVRHLSVAYVVSAATFTGRGYVPWFDRTLDRDDWCPLQMIDAADDNALLAACAARKIYFTPHPRYYAFPAWYGHARERRKYPITLCLRPDGNLYSMSLKTCYGSIRQTQAELNRRLEYQEDADMAFCKTNRFCLVRHRCRRTLRSGRRFCAYQALMADPETTFIPL